jgi:3-hydroxyisobutyrate dehydrogenase-like beta-hydroxyacid dehydrogenase
MPNPSGIIAEPATSAKSAGFAAESVGVVGLGHMGHTFATNLVEDGYQGLVHDRDPQRTAELQAPGTIGTPHLNDLAGCDVALTSLPDDDAPAAVALATEKPSEPPC